MNTIKVTGKGSVHVVADTVRLEVNIRSVYADYKQAYKMAKETLSNVVKVLEYNKLSGQLAKTVRLDISDNMKNEYEDGNYIGQIKDGFLLAQSIKIDLDIDNNVLNCVIKGIGKYVKDAQINIGYTVKDIRPYKLKMLSRAIKDAKEKAQIMVETLGCNLGNVSLIDYTEDYISFYSQARSIHCNEEAISSTPEALNITPDDLSVSDNVVVEWEVLNS